jgi:hypothetical protein
MSSRSHLKQYEMAHFHSFLKCLTRLLLRYKIMTIDGRKNTFYTRRMDGVDLEPRFSINFVSYRLGFA